MKQQINQVKSLAFVGGTHGNELTGVHLVPWLDKYFNEISSLIDIKTLIANPKAIKINKRYTEKDLNRCFSLIDLNRDSNELLDKNMAEDWEFARAREINQTLGPKDSELNTDFIVDIHNTTANMGASLIIGAMDEYLFYLCHELLKLDHRVKVYYMPEDRMNSPYLPSIAKRDLCLEMGPQSPGLLRADLFELGKTLSKSIVSFTEIWNQGQYQKEDVSLPHYRQFKNLDYPRDKNGRICGMIHPKLQDQDYNEFNEDTQSFFVDFEQNDIPAGVTGNFNPVFINEQAYYEKGIAMSLTRFRTLSWENWSDNE